MSAATALVLESPQSAPASTKRAKRPNGAGSVTPTKDGRFQVRIPVQGKRKSLGVYDTAEEADDVRHAALVQLSRGVQAPVGGLTLRMYAERWRRERELSGDYRDSVKHLGNWNNHIGNTALADMPLRAIKPKHIAAWFRDLRKKTVPGKRKKLERTTLIDIVSSLRSMFTSACSPEEDLLTENPVLHLRVKKERKTEEPWTYLRKEEIERVRTNDQIPDADRWMILFAIGTGLRLGEMMNLELRDLRVDGEHPELTVRFGSKGAAPKNGHIRVVPLFGIGLEAAREWLKLLPTYAPKNPLRLVFPTPRGARRGKGRHLHVRTRNNVTKRCDKHNPFRAHLAAVGITRRVRWHDLRHTCASMLVSGCWGRAWTMAEVKEYLGHLAMTSTQRYAHLAEGALRRAVQETNASKAKLVLIEGGASSAKSTPETGTTGAALSAASESLEVAIETPSNEASVGYPSATAPAMTVAQMLAIVENPVSHADEEAHTSVVLGRSAPSARRGRGAAVSAEERDDA